MFSVFFANSTDTVSKIFTSRVMMELFIESLDGNFNFNEGAVKKRVWLGSQIVGIVVVASFRRGGVGRACAVCSLAIIQNRLLARELTQSDIQQSSYAYVYSVETFMSHTLITP